MLASSPSPGPDPAYCRLLAYEMLFLWNALPSSQSNCVITQGIFNKAFNCSELCEQWGTNSKIDLKYWIQSNIQFCNFLMVAFLMGALLWEWFLRYNNTVTFKL